MPIVLWDRTHQTIIKTGGTPLVFKDNAAVDTWLARTQQITQQQLHPITIDRLTVTGLRQ